MRTPGPSIAPKADDASHGRRHLLTRVVVLAALLATIPVTVTAMTGGSGSAALTASTGAATAPTKSANDSDPSRSLRSPGSSVANTITIPAAPLRVTPITSTTSSTSTTVTSTATTRVVTSDRRVLAFLYPWFTEAATTDPTLSVHPTTPLLTRKLDSSIQAAQLARDHGIDGFVLSFAGGVQDGLSLHQTLAAAAATQGTATVLLETVVAGDEATMLRWMREALRQSDSPAFLRVDGIPTVFAFSSATLPGPVWGRILDQMAAEGRPVRVIGDSTPTLTNRMVGQFRYNALLDAASRPLSPAGLLAWTHEVSQGLRYQAARTGTTAGRVVATVQPGWDDHLIRGTKNPVVDRNGVSTYAGTWASAIASDAEWVLITSWNEWFEGTGIAPSIEHGTAALDATATWAARFRQG